MEKEKIKDKMKIAIYGVESFGYSPPSTPLETRAFILEFCELNAAEDLSDYDGVIFFGDTFETKTNGKIICENKGLLLKRMKQLYKLIEKGGFICCLFYNFQDEYHVVGYMTDHDVGCNDTSLGKVFLNDLGLNKTHRKTNPASLKFFKIIREEFKTYLSDYGVTKTYFSLPYDILEDTKPICESNGRTVGMVLLNSIFLLPCHSIDRDEKNTRKLFSTVVTAIVKTLVKLSEELPLWIEKEYVFPKEKELITELKEQKEIIEKIEYKLRDYNRLKRCLAFGDERLVDEIVYFFETFLNLKTTRTEEFIEDLKIFTQEDEMIAIAEVKGVNSGVKREHINQTDSHRERLGLETTFPALLIINTKMNATSLEDKNLEVASEQIKKATMDNVLILRTLDLLNLFFLEETGKIAEEEIVGILRTENGWLEVTEDSYEIRKA